MQPHEQRVVEEEKELSDKLNKLGEFIHGPVYKTIPEKDRKLLQEQATHMRYYARVLRRRIERFTMGKKSAGAILANASRNASAKAKKANPKLRRVKG